MKISRCLTAALALSASFMTFAESKPLTVGEVIKQAKPGDWRQPDAENLIYLEMETGRVIIELLPDLAPNHVKQIKALAREGFYDGLNFYRVIDGFVAQGGNGGEIPEIDKKYQIKQEFNYSVGKDFKYTPHNQNDGYAAYTGFYKGFPINLNKTQDKAWLTHCAGVLAMARSNSVDSGSTEIYVTLGEQRYLDNNTTTFGRVLTGLEHLQRLERSQNLYGANDVKGKNIIKSMRVAADVAEKDRTPIKLMKTDTQSFRNYLKARANRTEEWFNASPDFVGICHVTPPLRIIK